MNSKFFLCVLLLPNLAFACKKLNCVECVSQKVCVFTLQEDAYSGKCVTVSELKRLENLKLKSATVSGCETTVKIVEGKNENNIMPIHYSMLVVILYWALLCDYLIVLKKKASKDSTTATWSGYEAKPIVPIQTFAKHEFKEQNVTSFIRTVTLYCLKLTIELFYSIIQRSQ